MNTKRSISLNGLSLTSLIIAAVTLPSTTTLSLAESEAIPLNQLGAVATKQVEGDSLSVTATAEGARLHCAFQKLEGEATPEGLWLTSTADGATGEGFRLVVVAVGRTADAATATPSTHATPKPIEMPPGFGVRWQSGAATPLSNSGRAGQSGVALCFPPQSKALARTGRVTVDGQLVRFTRPGLTEEYSVSMDGVRQDFVVLERPAGEGELEVALAVAGARVEAMPGGAQLTLNGSGRTLVYSRLRATDATGRELPARMEVGSSRRDDRRAGGQHGVRALPTDAARSANGPYLLALLVDDTNALYPIRIDPTFSDADWVSLNPELSGATGPVNAIVTDSSGNLYVGGAFTYIGSVAANYIAKWDGNEWSALGSGTDSVVYALAVSGTDLYVGGYFTSAGGIAANRIAKWNGSSWSALGVGMNDSVFSVAVSGTTVYAGGKFSTAGGVSASRIAQWDGSAWSALGSGMNGQVNALAVSGTQLYAGGSFTTAGGATANRIARWNGSAWFVLGSGMDGGVGALLVNGADLYAGGTFATAGGVTANRIAKWNGITWSALGSGVNASGVNALAMIGTDLYVGGVFTTAGGVPANNIAKWDGSSWCTLGSGVNGYVYELGVLGTDLWVGGYFSAVDGAAANNIAKWNGITWSTLGAGIPFIVHALAMSETDLYAAAQFMSEGPSTDASQIYRWDGSAWSAVGSTLDGDVIALVMMGTNLYAGGAFRSAGGVTVNYIAKWDGSSWSALGSGMNGRVSALAVNGTDLYAGGYFTTAGGTTANRIAKWDGSSWSPLGLGLGGDNKYCHALAISGSDLYAGGSFTTAGGVPANGIAKWDGSSWSPLGLGLEGAPCIALAVNGTDLYAGGWFTAAGGVPANWIAKWDGTVWSALGSGMGGGSTVRALAINGSDLYAGGDFTTAGGVSATGIAKWNGSEWSALGSGLHPHPPPYGVSRVYALAADNSGHLFAGGLFLYAGTNFSPYIAQATIARLSYTWNAISSPQEAGVPFAVSVTAWDYDGAVRTNFIDTMTLSGYAPGLAATNFTLGNGTAAWGYPLHTSYHDARTQVIYPASELGRACTINSLALEVTTPPGLTLQNWTIRMKHTALAEYAPSPEWEGSDWTVVYQGDEPAGSTGWRTFEFSTPFEYNGSDNLLIDFSFNNTFYSSDGQCQSTVMGSYRSLTYASDSKDGDPLTWSGATPAPVRSYNVPNVLLGGTYPILLPVSISPANSGSFVNGVWTGEVTVHEVVSNLVLRANDGLGHDGESNPFDVVPGAAAVPQLQNCHLSAGQFAFDLSGEPGCKLLIQASTDLKHWVTLHGCYLTNSPLGFVDPESALYPKRYYRLMDAAGVALMEQQRWSGGQFHLNLVGELGRTVIVEASTNLADWTPIATNVLGNDPIPFTDPQSGLFSQRFYRLLMP